MYGWLGDATCKSKISKLGRKREKEPRNPSLSCSKNSSIGETANVGDRKKEVDWEVVWKRELKQEYRQEPSVGSHEIVSTDNFVEAEWMDEIETAPAVNSRVDLTNFVD